MAYTKNQFYLRRLHSLLGVIPIGGFLIVHLLVNHQATKGAEAFNQAAGFMESLPFLIILEFLFIYIPLLYHGIYGVHIAFTAQVNVGHYSRFRNVMFFLQRVTGIISFIFIAIHLWQTRIQKAIGGHEVNYNMIHDLIQSHPVLVLGGYIIGILAVVFHFSNGLWSFLVTWGVLQSKFSQRVFTWVSLIVFLIIGYIGVSAIIAFV
ncbi:succinate dehydrogenase cytochrome b558 subunit [Staphylococcus sp. SQ8-PEA]|uniref:Succinate dehydrogenase cytochrome b558 subunit n=1 Tax=Staphylococcus marylandisciuri TaxID=2981529 RepID=A0ABT2QP12_9STAP|nr:succinate dehydrogenase cytochrome b558 subunit [Staphylococcus marylandisciuri]MCU5745706.1 succinate dehydrogenase cytochrome b558 subunit [Staphylococcus marylandisciuri]